MAVFNEFIYFKKDYSGNTGDFSGKEEAIDANGRVRFLQAYSNFLVEQYGLKDGSKKVVESEEIASWISNISYDVQTCIRKTLSFDTMKVSLADSVQPYKGWRFYTERVFLENATLIFKDGWMPPVPCAKYGIENGKKLRYLKLRVYISSDYGVWEKTDDCDKLPHDTATGRIIEIRGGMSELVKIQFYADGRVFARVGIPDRYHHTKELLGKYEFDEWCELEFVFKENSYDCLLNGKITSGLLFTDKGVPDTLFLSGGMHAVGEWKVQPIQAVYDGYQQTEFFVQADSCNTEETPIGEVTLPYAVGGYKNRDKTLILRREFTAEEGKRALLTVDTLDPGGEVFVNGVRVCKTDGFMKQTQEISDVLCKGKNLLEIFVFPRAPEIPYYWHRCNDTYNAWLCGKVKIDFLPDIHITSLRIITNKVKPCVHATLKIALNTDFCGKYRVFIAKTNPDKGDEQELCVANIEGKETEIEISVQASVWTTETPALYAIRVQLEDENGALIDDFAEETGFRTIEQVNGDILLNGEKICLKGALIMQFLPPYENILKSHTCPTDEEIVWQIGALKKMNANVARLHILGYGTNDARFARFADRMGMTLIWTTRFIDSVESVKWSGEWKQAEGYLRQAREVINHPSIIMWEGSNEFHAGRKTHDALYDQFVSALKTVDTTRLLCPCSHLYYGGGLYGNEGFYYQDDGNYNQDFETAESSFGWKDPLVVRSAHTYDIMLGYGSDWGTFRKQGWKSESSLFNSKTHSYIVSEIAVIGRQDDTTKECETYVNNASYELKNEYDALGVKLEQKDWRLSQAYQALSAQHIVKSLLSRNADGIMWCCLSSGANDASYLKPPIDFYGYGKYAFYVLRDSFSKEICFNQDTAVVFGPNTTIKPLLTQTERNMDYSVVIWVKDADGNIVDEYRYLHYEMDEDALSLPVWKPNIERDGYYQIEYRVQRENICDTERTKPLQKMKAR